MKPNVKKIRLFKKKKTQKDFVDEDFLDKKLKEYYKEVDNEVPKSFENAIQTAFSSKENKKFLLLIAKKQNFADRLKLIREKISRSFLKVSQLAVVLFSCLCVTYFVHATSIVNYLAGFFNLSDININNSGIEQALEKGELQNVYMDYIRAEGVGVKVSYVLMNDLNLYLVFDIETDFSLKERDVNNVYFHNLVITNENEDIIYHQDINDNFKGNKVVVQDEHHMKNLIFMISDEIPISKSMKIEFKEVRFYKNKTEEKESNRLNEICTKMNFRYNIELQTENVENKIYDVIVKKEENPNVKISNAIFDYTGLNILIFSDISNFDIDVKNIFKNFTINSYYIGENKELNKREFVVNISEMKEKSKIKLKIKANNQINEYELIKK